MSVPDSKILFLFSFGNINNRVMLDKTINYGELVDIVKKKYSIKDDFCTSYKIGNTEYQVSDDDDLECFKIPPASPKGKVNTLVITEMRTPSPSNTRQSEVTHSSKKPSDYDLNSPTCDHMHHAPNVEVNKVFKHAWQANTQDYDTDHVPKIFAIGCGCVLSSGDKFDDKGKCIEAIGRKALAEGFEFKRRNTNAIRLDVVCAKEGCKWSILARKLPGSEKFELTTVNDVHTCPMTILHPNHRNATAVILSSLLVDKVADYARVYKPKDIQRDLKLEFNLDISYQKAWRGRQKAFDMVMGTPAASFAQLPYYCHNLKLANAGTVTHIETDAQGRFKQLYIGFGVAVSI